MEDSYTVHRRRKAAARRREKTPEPPRRHQDDVNATDEEEEARARMERLVQETERLEELEENERRRVENDKSGDCANTSVAEKPQRALKRAVSPDVRRKDEETHKEDEQPEPKLPVELPSSVASVEHEKTNVEKKCLQGEAKKASGDVGKSEVEEQPKDSVEEVAKKAKKEDVDVTATRATRRRPEVDRDRSPNVIEKPARSPKKASSSDLEKIDKNRASGEWSRDVAGGEDRAGKTSLRAGDDEQEEKQAIALDKNRHEAAAVARESDAGAVRYVSSSGRGESVKQQDLKRDEDEHGRSSRNADDALRAKKRDVSSPSKARSSESRAATTTSTSKRSGKERTVERTGYTTDSSETEETAKRVLRRKKSPEGAKARNSSARKTPSRSRATTDTDGDVEEHERNKRTEKRSTNRRRPSSDTDEDSSLKQRTSSPSHTALGRREALQTASKHGEKPRGGEKRSTSRPRPPSDTDEDFRPVRKSGSFPVDPPRDNSPSVVRSSSEIKKQIIPLSDDSLIEDFERAQREYLRRERSILDRDPLDDYVDPKMEAALRRRKFSIVRPESEAQEDVQQVGMSEKRSWFGWLPFFGRKAKKEKAEDREVMETEVEDAKSRKKVKEESKEVLKEEIPAPKKVSFLEFFRTLTDFVSEFRAFIEQNPRETRIIRVLRNRCMAELLLAIIYCGLGAFVFRFTEGAFETFYKCGVKRVKRDFLDSLWNFSHNMREEDWKSMARRKLMEFEEQLHTAHEAGVHSYSGQKSWSFLNAVVYCLTVITTIGYGHISPSTTTGRAITIVYAIFGIPMFLIILADFGKLFTRGIKFLWAFVRRVYYTGSCRRVRRTVPVQEVMKGVQLVYDLATFRRPSQMNPEEIEEIQKQQNQTQTVLNLDGNASPSAPGTPGTPAMSTFAIDDEFNLPISVAIIILLVYIFVGATVYNFWEEWGFFESFYFVFISMSTIGFGDYVPKHPIYMMLSIVYLLFGLALTSMCINVVQVMLSDSFKQASQKIGATIGFEVAEDDGSVQAAPPPPVEIADVHTTIKESESKEQIAPKAKQEDVEL